MDSRKAGTEIEIKPELVSVIKRAFIAHCEEQYEGGWFNPDSDFDTFKWHLFSHPNIRKTWRIAFSLSKIGL